MYGTFDHRFILVRLIACSSIYCGSLEDVAEDGLTPPPPIPYLLVWGLGVEAVKPQQNEATIKEEKVPVEPGKTNAPEAAARIVDASSLLSLGVVAVGLGPYRAIRDRLDGPEGIGFVHRVMYQLPFEEAMEEGHQTSSYAYNMAVLRPISSAAIARASRSSSPSDTAPQNSSQGSRRCSRIMSIQSEWGLRVQKQPPSRRVPQGRSQLYPPPTQPKTTLAFTYPTAQLNLPLLALSFSVVHTRSNPASLGLERQYVP